MAKIAHSLEEEQMKLHHVIVAALSEFSEKTGLGVTAANWECESIRDAKGHAVSFCYYMVSTSLATGFTG